MTQTPTPLEKAVSTEEIRKVEALVGGLRSWDLSGGVPGDLQDGLARVIQHILDDYKASMRILNLETVLGLSAAATGAIAGAAGYNRQIIELLATINTEED